MPGQLKVLQSGRHPKTSDPIAKPITLKQWEARKLMEPIPLPTLTPRPPSDLTDDGAELTRAFIRGGKREAEHRDDRTPTDRLRARLEDDRWADEVNRLIELEPSTAGGAVVQTCTEAESSQTADASLGDQQRQLRDALEAASDQRCLASGREIAEAARGLRRSWAEAAAGLDSRTGQEAQQHSEVSSKRVAIRAEQSIGIHASNVAIPGAPSNVGLKAGDLPTGPLPDLAAVGVTDGCSLCELLTSSSIG